MTTQTTPPGLAAALAAFQGEVPTFPKSKTAKVKSQRTGGEYTYKYTDLGDILPIVGPLLAKQGLAWTSKPGQDENGNLVLAYQLLHVSGEADAGVMPLGVDRNCKPQELGSAITYARRYAITAQLNLATDEDDDGAVAHAAGRTARTTNGHHAQADPPQATEPLITSKQRGLLHARCGDIGLDDDTRHALIHCITGQPHSDRIPKRLLGHDGSGGEPRDGILGVLASAKAAQITPQQLLSELRSAYSKHGGPLGENVGELITSIPDAAIAF